MFNEPAAPATVASGAPSVNIHGVSAAAGSATTVPVMGTLAAPLPGATYAAGYAPTAVGGVSVRAGEALARPRLCPSGLAPGVRACACRAGAAVRGGRGAGRPAQYQGPAKLDTPRGAQRPWSVAPRPHGATLAPRAPAPARR